MSYQETIEMCDQCVQEAEAKAYDARSEAIEAIIKDATPNDTALLLSWFLGRLVAELCEEHREEMREEIDMLIDSSIDAHDRMFAEVEADDEAADSVKH